MRHINHIANRDCDKLRKGTIKKNIVHISTLAQRNFAHRPFDGPTC